VTVKLSDAVGCWPDYVFSDEYKMVSNDSLRTFIETENHLPDMPTTSQVASNGLNTSEMFVKLLKNQEELTLRLLELDMENEKLKAEIDKLRKK
jgi:hypothetical protein